MLALTLHHVKSCDNIVGIAVKQFPVSVKDIEYAIVSAARKQPAFAILCDDKALLMRKIVLGFYSVFQTEQLSVALRIAPPACDAAEQEQLIVKLHIAVYQPDIRQFENIRINADVALAVVMRFGSLSLHNDLCSMVEL